MRKSVLIVDNEKVLCNGIEQLLSDDYKSYKAFNGREALDIINRNIEINVMLCDLKMPEMDGNELIEKIRADNKDIYIIVMTGSARPERVCDAMKKGANNFIRKPFDIDLLKLSVRNAVKNHDAAVYKTVFI